jgi:exodeoxyribonuclease VII small subunit
MDADGGFEGSLHRLERAVEELEGGDLGLDDALAKYEEGVRLLARCHGLLDAAERKVALLTGVDEDGRPATEPFDAAAAVDRGSAAGGRDDGEPS